MTARLVAEARRLEAAGASLLDFTQLRPGRRPARSPRAVSIPVIGGLGGGPWLDGRMRMVNAAIGYAASTIDDPPDTYANVARIALDAITAYADDVRAARQIKGGIPRGKPAAVEPAMPQRVHRDIDGIATRYEVIGSGPPLLMFSPGGFDATLEKWTTLGIYAQIKMFEPLPQQYTCIVFDRRECGQSGGRVERVAWAALRGAGQGPARPPGHRARAPDGRLHGLLRRWPRSRWRTPQVVVSMVLYWPVGGARYRINGQQRFADHLAFVQRARAGCRRRRWCARKARPSTPIRAAGRGPR